MVVCKTSIGEKNGKPILCGKRVPKRYLESHQRGHCLKILWDSGKEEFILSFHKRPLTEERAKLHKQLRRERKAS